VGPRSVLENVEVSSRAFKHRSRVSLTQDERLCIAREVWPRWQAYSVSKRFRGWEAIASDQE
jgi:hypothetical protein